MPDERRGYVSGELPESGWEKTKRKFAAEPLVPGGALVTAVILGRGLLSFRRGQMETGQKYMRARVAAQAFTVVAIVYGSYDRIFPKESILAAKFSEYANYARRHFGMEEHHRAIESSDASADTGLKSEWSDVPPAIAAGAVATPTGVTAAVDGAPADTTERVSWYSYFMGSSKPPVTTSTVQPVPEATPVAVVNVPVVVVAAEPVSWYSYFMGTSKPPATTSSAEPVTDTK